ncbi:hypothetical protein BD413DRAFT_283469 [Trametes elegans]|nr:hypothetical protein BD413DRAFT_283469 [Trametes elegans]
MLPWASCHAFAEVYQPERVSPQAREAFGGQPVTALDALPTSGAGEAPDTGWRTPTVALVPRNPSMPVYPQPSRSVIGFSAEATSWPAASVSAPHRKPLNSVPRMGSRYPACQSRQSRFGSRH